MPYSLDPTDEQNSIVEALRKEFPALTVIPDGMPDASDDEIETFPDGSVKPFLVLWFAEPRRTSGRSFADYRLDAHEASVDVVGVARDATTCRLIMNQVSDFLIGFKTSGGGRLHKGESLWGDSRRYLDDSNKPARWVRTSRFQFGIASRKIL